MKYTLLLTAALLSFGGCSMLKPHYNDEQMHTYLFNKFDSNQNGIITETEYMEFIDERFVKMDTDRNGTITKEDLYESRFYTFLPALSEAVFRDSDTNGDDLINKDEMVNAEEINFAKMDKNGDGELTEKEFVVNDMTEFKK